MGKSMKVKPVSDPSFGKYGRVITGFEVGELAARMKETPLPEDTIYVADDPALREGPVCEAIAEAISYSLFGGMPVQIGYCNGHNRTLNAVEYHRNSEINIPVTDAVFIVGQQQDIEADFTYDTSKMEAFYAPAGSVIELYATTLHYAPCDGKDDGFKVVVVLPEGTNTELPAKKKQMAQGVQAGQGEQNGQSIQTGQNVTAAQAGDAVQSVSIAEDRLLFAKNKWLIAHEESGLGADGAFVGLKGENLKIGEF